MSIAEFRQQYHRSICERIVRIKKSERTGRYPNFADGNSKSSVRIAWGVAKRLNCTIGQGDIKGQRVGSLFEVVTKEFLEKAFELLHHLRPGKWHYSVQGKISEFDQYEHLARVEEAVRQNKDLASALGKDYIATPDIVIGRSPVSDQEVNLRGKVVDGAYSLAELTPFRAANREATHLILHASISCKWTIRSDRAQNTRTEALNLIRNRKGNLPHVVVVSAEPLPTRLATLALGTGDLDCVYHFALPELKEAIEEIKNEDQLDMLNMLIQGRRLRDISDLPFDLAV